ncbi:ino eighty subunit 6 [Pyrrhoderma noxium]|uniref:Ino eighty subunit 6 n=1 Tax=Pyrrhoderma noxium TaxID=2282107 RepID=A0A286UBR6_9AGAM|nr:ino eighty subunit 6 [Pyrrhoderma noxium]
MMCDRICIMPPKGSGKRKAAATPATVGTPTEERTPQTPSFAESLSYLHYARPFKNPAYTKNTNRRTKNLKAVLTQERERERAERERRRIEREEALKTVGDGTVNSEEQQDAQGEKVDRMDVDEAADNIVLTSSPAKLHLIQDEDLPTYASIEAPPSFLPQKHYCDITGLEAPYTDPATGLRYHDKSIYEHIKSLNASAVKEYLALRGVNPIVR